MYYKLMIFGQLGDDVNITLWCDAKSLDEINMWIFKFKKPNKNNYDVSTLKFSSEYSKWETININLNQSNAENHGSFSIVKYC